MMQADSPNPYAIGSMDMSAAFAGDAERSDLYSADLRPFDWGGAGLDRRGGIAVRRRAGADDAGDGR